MKKFFTILERIEFAIAMVCVVGFTSVLMIGAIFRATGHPLNWCNDIALLMLAWTIFLGGDIAFRSGRMVNVDIVISKAPVNLQKCVAVVVYFVLLLMMCTMVWQGFQLCANVGARRLEGISALSYVWVAASMPVGFSFMIITAVNRLIGILKSNDPAEISKM